MSGEFENIDLSITTTPDYAQVIFHNIPETYPTSIDIECSYTITASLKPSNRDWVGLYKVGWRSSKDYTSFNWSKIPEGQKDGRKVEVSIIFSASTMPKDDGEFYQFCYVTNSGHVRGASTPFQFRVPGADDYVEVEDEEDDILVIKTKTTVLEDKLVKAEHEKDELSKTIEYLEKEKESLLSNLIDAEKIMAHLKENNTTVTAIHKTVSENLEEQKIANKELSLLHSSLKEKISFLNQEKESCVKRLDESDDYICSLQQEIKTLNAEKDSLAGFNKSLEEQKELFKTHFATSEDQVKRYLLEMDDLGKRLQQEEQKSAELRIQVDDMQAQLTEEQVQIGDLQLASEADKVTITELTEKLQNSEDKLDAAEKCKEILINEVTMMKQTLQKLSADLEESKSDSHSYKSQLSRQQGLVVSYTEKVNMIQKALDDKDQELQTTTAEYEKLKEMKQEVESKEKEEEEGAQFALSMAYDTLKQRYDKIRNQREEIQKQFDDAMNKLRQSQEKDDVIGDMKERLRLGQEQYQYRVIECKRLQKELKKALRANKAANLPATQPSQQQKTASQVKTGECQTEVIQMTFAPEVSGAASGSDTQAASVTSDGDLTEVIIDNPSLVEQTTSELQAQLTDLGHELEIRQKKKNKYKTLYQEEKEKRAYIERYHIAEAAKKDNMIKSLSEQLDKSAADYLHHIDQLQSAIDMQAVEIDGLHAERNMDPSDRQQVHYPPQAPYHIQSIPLMPTNEPAPRHPPYPIIYPNQRPPYDQLYMQAPPTAYTPCPIVPPIPPRKCEVPDSQPTIRSPSTQAGPAPLTDGDTPVNLAAPLKPLPPPLSPQRSREALVAEVKAINDGIQDALPMAAEGGQEEEEEERFHDAEDHPEASAPLSDDNPLQTDNSTEPAPSSIRTMTQCPICNMIFPNSIPENEIIMHVETHMARVCPMCNDTFDDSVTPEDFQEHVNTHFRESE